MLCHPHQLWCCLPVANRSLFVSDCTPGVEDTGPSSFGAPASTARSSAVPGQGISPTQIHGDSSSSDGISYSLFPDLAFLPDACTAEDVCRAESRERASGFGCGNCPRGSSGCWVGGGSPGGEEVPLAGSLHPLSLVAHVEAGKAEPHSRSQWCLAGRRRQSPVPQALRSHNLI